MWLSNSVSLMSALVFSVHSRLSSVVNDCPTAASSPILRVTANNSSTGGGGAGGGGSGNRGRSSPVSFLSSSSISNSSGGPVGSAGLSAVSPGGGGGGAVAAAMTTQWVIRVLKESAKGKTSAKVLMKIFVFALRFAEWVEYHPRSCKKSTRLSQRTGVTPR